MRKVKITVLSVDLKTDLIRQYGFSELKACPRHHIGESFITDFRKPHALCEDAWGCMEKFVFTLAHTKGPLFWDDWAQEGKAVICCNDGFRPVTFLIESMDEDAPPF